MNPLQTLFNAHPVFAARSSKRRYHHSYDLQPLQGPVVLHFTQTHVSGSLSRRTHAVPTMTGAARDFQADREQDRHRRLPPRLSERGITVELRAPTERRNESARPVIVTSLANKPGPSPASELFRNLPHFS